MKRMLINATQQEELRVAMVDGQRLYDLNIELPASERKKANIYKGKITRIEPSLEAAFVDYGAERHGFLPLKEISSEYFVANVEQGAKPNIREVLNEGQDIVVQIDKEERGNKGAALTTYVSLAGRFIVLKPNKSRSGGVSRRIVGQDRELARKSLAEIEVPPGMSVILRTAGIDRSAEELAWDLENLMSVWQAILNVVLQRPSPFLIYRESNAVVRALRDYLTSEIGEILIDDDATYQEAYEFIETVMPHNLRKLKQYTDPVPLFTRYQIESQIESAFAHGVTLPSGGSIVIDHTEALVSIDINSARATKGGDIEATALNTNLEAADEIARQLRIRDLGGLVVIDFIDMGPQRHQRDVENRLREAVRADRARVQIGKISRFGLLEMSRQRLRPSIGESSYHTCPRCSGFGTIRSVESLALAILRLIGEEARKERTAKVIAQLPVEVATYLLNEKRDWVRNLETSHDTHVILVANALLETPHYEVRRVRDDQTELPENVGVSYALANTEQELQIPEAVEERKVAEKAAIEVIKPATPAPTRKTAKKSLWARLVEFFSTDREDVKKKPARSQSRRKKPAGRSAQRGRRSRATKGGQKAQKQHAGKRKSAKQSGSKKPAAKKKQAKAPADEQQETSKKPAGSDDTRSDQRKPSRARRSRGGRRRRRAAGGTDEKKAPRNESAVEGVAESTTGKSETIAPASEAAPRAPERSPQPAPKPAASSPPSGASHAAGSGENRPEVARPATPPPAAQTTREGNGSPAAKTAEPSKPEATKSEGRLLPWDTPSTSGTQKPAEKPVPDSSSPGSETPQSDQ